ncbi:ABC transporter substrate-binding protein [Paracoccus aminovorans]|uniref:ABC transporter substrate-binding protein n=1 Tax=Paracoccus aminovorans TaxID=34004 RepID=UPI002B257B29|nr:ABC transporter substrate-binding protein [Paracoccus aminovorans]
MKPSVLILLIALLAPLGVRAETLTVQLRGPALAESAGFLWAQARGLYAAEGLDVTLLPADDAPPFESLARGVADLTVEWMPMALVARENGLRVVNVAQILAQPAQRLTCRREAGVETAADLRGKTLANTFRGTEYPLLAWLNRLGLKPDDSLSGVALLAQWPGAAGGAEMLRHHQAACATTLAYDPLPGDGLVVLDPATEGTATLEDGLYALPATLADPQAQDRLARFLRASMKGWHEAVADPEAAAGLILGPDPDAGALHRQAAMIEAIGPLLSPSGALDEDDYRRTVDILRAGSGQAILRRDPGDAFIAAVTTRMALPEAAASSTADAAP